MCKICYNSVEQQNKIDNKITIEQQNKIDNKITIEQQNKFDKTLASNKCHNKPRIYRSDIDMDRQLHDIKKYRCERKYQRNYDDWYTTLSTKHDQICILKIQLIFNYIYLQTNRMLKLKNLKKIYDAIEIDMNNDVNDDVYVSLLKRYSGIYSIKRYSGIS